MEIVLRATAVFVFLFLLTRGLRRRTLGEMAPFELLLLVVVGDIVQQGITQEDMSVTGAVLSVSTFAFWASVLVWLTWKSGTARKIVDGVPIVLVQDGKPIDANMAAEQMPLDEVEEAARQAGVEHLADVRLAVLEPSGRISIIKRDPSS